MTCCIHFVVITFVVYSQAHTRTPLFGLVDLEISQLVYIENPLLMRLNQRVLREKTELYCIIIQNALLYTLYIIYIRHTNVSLYIYIQNCKPVFCLQKNMTELSVHVKKIQRPH